jgi:hypothetical protein
MTKGWRFSPDAGQAGDALGFDGEVGAGADQDFFEAADEIYCAEMLARGSRKVPRLQRTIRKRIVLCRSG